MNWASVGILAVFFLYTFVSWSVLGPLDSVSQTWYLWKDRNYSSAFNIFGLLACIACAFEAYYYPEGLTRWFFLASGLSIWFLTIASPYKQYNTYHLIPTFLSIILGFCAVWAQFGFTMRFYVSLGSALSGVILMRAFGVPYSTTFAELWIMVCVVFFFLWT